VSVESLAAEIVAIATGVDAADVTPEFRAMAREQIERYGSLFRRLAE
jgi:hypothetical protein